MAYEVTTWRCDGQDISLGLDRIGDGPTLLLLPALSSISTRREMRPLQERLAQTFTTIAVDWPGFGNLDKPYVDWRPEIYEAFVRDLLDRVAPNPYAIVSAGHATGYVLRAFAGRETAGERLVLLSPTWRGPLPTMMGGYRALFPKIATAVDRPILGPLLYGLNVNRPVVGMMARGHVYADPGWLGNARMSQKLAVTKTVGARHGSARFVTGGLDPFSSREAQMQAARRVAAPMLSLFSANAPRKSLAEMEALASLPNIQTSRLPRGKLSFYEEFPGDAFEAMSRFLLAANPV